MDKTHASLSLNNEGTGMVAEAETATMSEAERLERRRANQMRLIAVLAHVAAFALWEILVRAFEVPRFILPAPSEVLATLGSARYDWIGNSWVTGAEIVGGYALATVLGVLTALMFSWSRVLTLVFFPLLVTLNMIPKVALGPLVIVWFSYGISTNILITFSLCYFPILLTTVRGLREVEPDLLDLVKSLRGSRWQMFRYIQLPGAMPYIFSGMKFWRWPARLLGSSSHLTVVLAI
jgi:NitT/TauT family transport system permease protein